VPALLFLSSARERFPDDNRDKVAVGRGYPFPRVRLAQALPERADLTITCVAPAHWNNHLRGCIGVIHGEMRLLVTLAAEERSERTVP
jgi:hypothetical protein